MSTVVVSHTSTYEVYEIKEVKTQRAQNDLEHKYSEEAQNLSTLQGLIYGGDSSDETEVAMKASKNMKKLIMDKKDALSDKIFTFIEIYPEILACEQVVEDIATGVSKM